MLVCMHVRTLYVCLCVCTYELDYDVTRAHIFSRVKFAAARDGLLPSFLSGVHNTYHTPLPAIIVSVSLIVTLTKP